MSERKIALWFLVLLSMLVILPFLGETPFYSKGEPREAIVAYTMLESGNWILPLNYGADMAYKPPFLYWAIACFSAILPGGVTEYASRLPSALSFLAMLWVVFNFFSRRKGVPTALLSCLLLLTSFEVHRAAVACRLDMLQVSLIVIALLQLYRWDEKGCRTLPWLAVLLMAAASLTKGPVGTIFPCLIIGVYQLVRGKRFVRAFFPLTGIGLLSLVPLALWFWAAYRQGGDAFSTLMLEENTGRFFNKMSYESHENPLWYNFLTLIWGWIPWTVVLLISLFYLRWKKPVWRVRWRAMWHAFRSQSPVQLLTWLAIVLIFVFYCIPKSKRSVYLLPMYPFMAVLIAEYLLALVQRKSGVFKASGALFLSIGILLTVVFATVKLGWVPDSVMGSGRHAAENIGFMHALRDTTLSIPQWLLVALPLIAAGCIGWELLKQKRPYTLLYSIAGMAIALFVVLDGVYQPAVLAVKSDKHLADQIRERVPEGAVYSYANMSFYSVNYYLNDAMRHFEVELPREGYVIVPSKQVDNMRQTFGSRYRFDELFVTARRSCDLRDKIYMFHFKAN
ncbi:MAG: glycosyltransferase family 39 protein [Prevotellaceae bacterium]|jgi:4-amino-4-deoxy-L-arabinose transferase-like glycosyltransferase|nr:glycosyltransferase family 39 protein [Prevotellaceae bacterium]